MKIARLSRHQRLVACTCASIGLTVLLAQLAGDRWGTLGSLVAVVAAVMFGFALGSLAGAIEQTRRRVDALETQTQRQQDAIDSLTVDHGRSPFVPLGARN